MLEPGTESLEAYQNPPTYSPQDFLPTNVFTGIIQYTLGFAAAQVWILDEDGYDTQYTVLYWNFSKMIEWCQFRDNIHVRHSGIYFEDINIKILLALNWWVTDLTLQGKIWI